MANTHKFLWATCLVALIGCGTGAVGSPEPPGDTDGGDDDEPLDPMLAIQLAGAGGGVVVSDVGGLHCPGTCTTRIAQGTPVLLTADGDFGSTFTGWTGDCAGSNPEVTIVIDADVSCVATFSGSPSGDLLAAVIASREVARIPANDAPISDSQIDLYANAEPAVDEWAWSVRDSKTGAEVFTSTDEDPVFTCPAVRATYDVELGVSDGTSFDLFRYRRLITCTLPRTDAGRQVFNVALSGDTSIVGGEIAGTVVPPGAVVRVSGTIAKNWFFANFQGTAEAPIHIINDGLVTNHATSGVSRLLHLYNCRFVVIDGMGDDDHEYGIVLTNDSTTTFSQAMLLRDQDESTDPPNAISSPPQGGTDIEIFGVHIDGNKGTGIEVNTKGSASFNRTNWRFENLSIHHTLIEGTGNEGYYLGYTVDWLSPTYGDLYLPYQQHHSAIYRNILRDTGKDGIQVCNSQDFEVHDNTVEDVGTTNTSGHLSSMQVNSGSSGHIYRNSFSGGVGINMQMGCTGDDIFMYSNLVVRGDTAGSQAAYIIAGWNAGANVHFFGNTIVSDRSYVVRLNMDSPGCGQSSGTQAKLAGLHIANNLLVIPSAADVYACASGPSVCPSGVVENRDLRRDPGAMTDLCFADAGEGNYTLACEGSAALSGTGADLNGIGAIDTTQLPLGAVTDLEGRVVYDARDFGAYQAPSQ